MTQAAERNAVAEVIVPSKSLASRRLRLIQAKKCSTTQRRGKTLKPNRDGGGVCDLFARIGAVGKHHLDEGEASPLDEGEASPARFQHRRGTIAVLDRGRLHLQLQTPAVGVHQRVTLAALDLLGGVKPAWTAGLGGLDAPAVEHRRRGAGLTSQPAPDRA